MKEYSVKIMNVADLIAINSFIHKNHIKGEIVQRNFKARAGSFLGVVIALPLDSATLVVEKCDEAPANGLMPRLQRA